MTRASPDPRLALRDLTLALAALLPYARQGGGGSLEAAQEIANARRLLDHARQLDGLPWSAVMDASLAHLSPAEREALQSGHTPDPFTLCMTNDHAYMVFRADGGTADAPVLGPGLSAIAARAADHGFRYVRLDEDCATVPGLETYP